MFIPRTKVQFKQFYPINSSNNLCNMRVLLKQFIIQCIQVLVMFLIEGDVSDVVNTSGNVVSVVCGV